MALKLILAASLLSSTFFSETVLCLSHANDGVSTEGGKSHKGVDKETPQDESKESHWRVDRSIQYQRMRSLPKFYATPIGSGGYGSSVGARSFYSGNDKLE